MPTLSHGTDDAGAPATKGIEEIVVTAQRREENVQRTPVPVTVLPGKALRDAGVTRPQELTHLDVSLQTAQISGSTSLFYLRGVGNLTGTSLADPAVAFNFNDVYIGRPSATGAFFYDLERVEILKGPQGTLYGRNATGGAINVLPRRPVLGESDGELSFDYGNYDAARVDGAMNIPLGDRAAVRVAGIHVRHDAYMNDGTDDQDDSGGRLSFLLNPTPGLSINFAADYFDQGGDGPGSTPVALGPDHRFGVSSARGGAFYQTQRVSIAGRNFNPIPGNQSFDNQFWGASSTVDWVTDLGTLTFVPAYREGHLDTISSAAGLTLTSVEDDQQTSVEARFASDSAQRLSYIVGAYYLDETDDVDHFVPNPQYNMSIQIPKSGVESTAVFGSLTFAVTRDVRATAGARYTDDSKFFHGTFEGFNRACPPVPTASCPNAERFPVDQLTPPLTFPSPDAQVATPVFNPLDGTITTGFRIRSNEHESFSRTTWRAAVDWDVSDRNLVFASVETGFKSGGFFFSNDSQTFKPEELTAFTVGAKNRLPDNRLQLNVEVFDWEYQDQQISMISLDSQGAQNLRTENIGKATIRGAEVDTEWRLGTNTLLSLDVQYLDATYDEFRFNRPAATGPPLTGCDVTPAPVPPGPAGFTVDCSGKRAPYAPEWTINVAAQQTVRFDRGALVASVRARYQTEILTGLDFTPLEYQDDYWSIDVSATFTSADDRYSVGLFGLNVTDETVVANTFQPPLGQFVVGTLRPPRLYGVRLGVRL